MCEDVYALAGVQFKTIRERLPRKSEAMLSAVGQIMKTLYTQQKKTRDQFLVDFETCCAGANDFVRMSEKLEDILYEIRTECTLTEKTEKILDEQSGLLLAQYSADAVYAAQKTSVYIFEAINEEIGEELFSDPWLDEYTDNDLGNTIVVTIEDFLGDLNSFLDSIMVQKVLEALIARTITYYIETLLSRSPKHKRNQSYFADNKRALDRMEGDMRLCKEFFEGQAEEDFPTLSRVIDTEFEFFDTVHEMLAIASGNSDEDIQDLTFVFCRRVKNFEITKMIVGDLYHLVNPGEEKNVYEVIDGLEEELKSYEEEDSKDPTKDRSAVPGVKIETMFANHIKNNEGERKRPIKGQGGGVLGGLFG